MEIEVFTYRVAYAIAMTVMGAVAYRFKQHADEPETFLAMVVPVVIPIAQQAFSVGSGSNTSQVAPLNESSLLLMVVALSSSYFLGSVLAWAIDKKKNRKDQQNVDGDFRPFYVSFILWGALYGGLTVGARIREVNDGLLLIFSLGVLISDVSGCRRLWLAFPRRWYALQGSDVHRRLFRCDRNGDVFRCQITIYVGGRRQRRFTSRDHPERPVGASHCPSRAR